MPSSVAEVETIKPAAAQRRLYPVLILAVALVLRLAVVFATAHNPTDTFFHDRGQELGNLAESIRTGHGFSSPFGGSTGPSAFLAPGYPGLVAVVFALFGSYSRASALCLMLLQALFGAATVWTLMLLGRRAFGQRVANVAGLVWSFCPLALILPTLFWETSLSILLATSLVAMALAARDRHTVPHWLAMGLLAALVLAVNPSLLPILAGCYGWALFQARRLPLTPPVCSLLLCLLLSAPWAIRNAVKLHAFIPFRSNAGYELWQGNRPGADGFFSLDLHPTANPQEFARYASLGEVAYMHQKSAEAQAAIAADPVRFIALTARRTLAFWTGRSRQSGVLEMAYTTAGSALGLLGLALLWRRNRSLAMYFLLPLLLFPLPYCITHPDIRFRMVLDPILVMLAVYALTPRRAIVDLTLA